MNEGDPGLVILRFTNQDYFRQFLQSHGGDPAAMTRIAEAL